LRQESSRRSEYKRTWRLHCRKESTLQRRSRRPNIRPEIIKERGPTMRKIYFALMLLTVAALLPPSLARAEVNVSIGFALPEPVVFAAPPEMVVLPESNDVYVAPDSDVDLFFWNGLWWRPWEGRWYRSHWYNRGWTYYHKVPSFYYDVDPGWRGYYRDRNWSGNRWDYERIPNQRLNRNWKKWQTNHYWQRNNNWGVENHQPRPQQHNHEIRQQRQERYQQLPEVQRHQQQMQDQTRSPQIQRQIQRPPRQLKTEEQQMPAPRHRHQAQQQQQDQTNKQPPQMHRQQEKQTGPGKDVHDQGRRDHKKSSRPQSSREEQANQAGEPGKGQ
jgi:hypothetical protein